MIRDGGIPGRNLTVFEARQVLGILLKSGDSDSYFYMSKKG
jgi:hypothetical protein